MPAHMMHLTQNPARQVNKNMDYFRQVWYWFKSRTPHKCENWQTLLGNQKAGVIFCNICGKILDGEMARNE
jgi:hypothetical protein